MAGTNVRDGDLEEQFGTLTQIAAHGLDTAIALPTDLGPDLPSLLDQVERHRLAGHLAALVKDGAVELSDADAELIADREAAWSAHNLEMERLLVAAVSVLDEAAIEVRVFKGPALAHTVYADPSHRSFGDLDLLVPSDALADARAALTRELGAVDVLPELRPGFDSEFGKEVLLRVGEAEIDLHRTIAAGPYGLRINLDDLFAAPSTFTLGAKTMKTFAPAQTFLQVCHNAALGEVPPRLGSLRDVAQVHQALQPSHPLIMMLTDLWQATAVVQRAVNLTWDTLQQPASELSEWAQIHKPSAFEKRLLEATVSRRRSYTRHLAALTAVKGIRGRARYLRAIVQPSADYLDARGWSQGDHVRRAWGRLRRR